jgi:putative N6-adenine-specific DNA methylase
MDLFVSCAPGLEEVLEAELVDLGFAPSGRESGGVLLSTDLGGLYRVNARSGVAIKVLVRLGTFAARRFDALVKRVAQLDWAPWIGERAVVRVRAVCRKSRLYHSGAVAERVTMGLEAAGVQVLPKGSDAAQVEVLVRLEHDQCTVSVNTSGEPLHRRGYRLQTAKAPVREDLARALVLVSGWRGTGEALYDPFCGSGTICIEAALLAAGLAPGRGRRFSYMDMPCFDEGLHGAALSTEHLGEPAKIVGSDRDAGAILAATANAERAGVQVDFVESPISTSPLATRVSTDGCTVVTNPPYGRRVSAGKELRNLYARLGQILESCGASRCAMVTPEPALATVIGSWLESRALTDHGGMKIYLFAGTL